MENHTWKNVIIKLNLVNTYPAIVFLIATLLAYSSVIGGALQLKENPSNPNENQVILTHQTMP